MMYILSAIFLSLASAKSDLGLPNLPGINPWDEFSHWEKDLPDWVKNMLPVEDRPGNCNNTDDIMAIVKIGGVKEIGKAVKDCGLRCGGRNPCVGSCMHHEHGTSKDCGQCFGIMTSCTMDHCSTCEIHEHSDSCKDCLKTKCMPQVGYCVGLGPMPDPEALALGVSGVNFTESAAVQGLQELEGSEGECQEPECPGTMPNPATPLACRFVKAIAGRELCPCTCKDLYTTTAPERQD